MSGVIGSKNQKLDLLLHKHCPRMTLLFAIILLFFQSMLRVSKIGFTSQETRTMVQISALLLAFIGGHSFCGSVITRHSSQPYPPFLTGQFVK